MAEQTVTLLDVAVDGADRADLVAFLSLHRFPFHVNGAPSGAVIEQQLAEGAWGGAADEDRDHRTLWVVHDHARVGVLRLDDLSDNAPLSISGSPKALAGGRRTSSRASRNGPRLCRVSRS